MFRNVAVMDEAFKSLKEQKLVMVVVLHKCEISISPNFLFVLLEIDFMEYFECFRFEMT